MEIFSRWLTEVLSPCAGNSGQNEPGKQDVFPWLTTWTTPFLPGRTSIFLLSIGFCDSHCFRLIGIQPD